jgi:hypothetical protein
MFHLYNTMLRQFPADLHKTFQAKNNTFATTIHVLASAVVNISRVMELRPGVKLYRGLGGLVVLPDSFYKVGGEEDTWVRK